MINKEKYALITGATSGIGYELAKLFAKDQYSLVIVARNEEELLNTSSSLKEQYNIEVITISKDLFEREAPFELFEEVKRRGITINILVNNAGQGQYGEFVETDLMRELDIIQLNIASLTILTKLYLKEMVGRNEGKILNLASIAGRIPGPFQSVYHATKAYVLSLTEALHNEIKDTNVTITALLPGATDTNFFHKAEMEDAKLVKEGKMSDPADVAKDGYEALMSGKEKVVSGFKTKMQNLMGSVLPDSVVIENLRKQQEPSKD